MYKLFHYFLYLLFDFWVEILCERVVGSVVLTADHGNTSSYRIRYNQIGVSICDEVCLMVYIGAWAMDQAKDGRWDSKDSASVFFL